MRNAGSGGLVASTDGGRMCPACRKPLADCACGKQAMPAAGDGIARVSREKQGRGGKTVTVVRGLPVDEPSLQALGKQLRTACGAGGTVRDGTLEVQGDHVDRALAFLQAHGYRTRRSGG